MSEIIPSGKDDQVGDLDQGQKQVSQEAYKKLLGETKKERDEKRLLQARIDEFEQQTLEAKGQLKEALDNQKKQTEKFKNDNVEIIKRVGIKAARSQFAREAEKLGCVDVNDLFQLTDFSDLEMDAEFEYDQKKLIDKIQEHTKSKPHFFKKDFLLPNDITPSNAKSESFDLSKLDESQIKQLLKTAK